jgi:hypothetical protein
MVRFKLLQSASKASLGKCNTMYYECGIALYLLSVL